SCSAPTPRTGAPIGTSRTCAIPTSPVRTRRNPSRSTTATATCIDRRTHEAKGQRAKGRGQRAKGRGQRAEGKGQRAEGRGQRTKGRGDRTEGSSSFRLCPLPF